MAYRLWSMDPEAGEAVVVRDGAVWYFVSSENGWRPFEIDEETAVGWWLSGAGTEEEGGDFRLLEEAIAVVRERFLASMGPTAPRLIGRRGPPGPLSLKARQALKSYVALRAGEFLRRFGCNEPESAELKAEVVRHFQEQGGGRESKHDLDVLILGWTRKTFLRRFGETRIRRDFPQSGPKVDQSAHWVNESRQREEERFLQTIQGFPLMVVRCLALWSEEEGCTVQEISILLRLPKELVQEHLAWASNRLGLALDHLRAPLLASACRRLMAWHTEDI